MATYYVSTQRGDDNRTGTQAQSPSTPWKTVGKAVGYASLAAGDTVYIGPGTYRELISLAKAGNSSAWIYWKGDPDAVYVTGDTPGRVRLTGAPADTEIAPATTTWAFNSKEYNKLSNLWIDGGGAGLYAIMGSPGSRANYILESCVLAGARGGYGVTVDKCVIIGGALGVISSIAINSVAISGGSCFQTSDAKHCLAIGGTYGYTGAGTFISCIAMGSSTAGYTGDSTATTITNCYATNCYRVAYGTSTTNPLNISNLYYSDCSYTTRGSGYETGTLNVVGSTLFNFESLFYAVPWMAFGLKSIPYPAVTPPTTDIFGNPRPLGASADIGPAEVTISELSYTTGDYHYAAPAIKLTGSGTQIIRIPAKSGKTVTVTAEVKHVSTSGDKPQMILSGSGITTQTYTSTAADSTWQTAVLSATAPVDTLFTLMLYARDNTAGAVAYFSDIATEEQ